MNVFRFNILDGANVIILFSWERNEWSRNFYCLILLEHVFQFQFLTTKKVWTYEGNKDIEFMSPWHKICVATTSIGYHTNLLLASCWLRCVLEEQLAMSVSASFRILSDLVRDEWALKYKNWPFHRSTFSFGVVNSCPIVFGFWIITLFNLANYNKIILQVLEL